MKRPPFPFVFLVTCEHGGNRIPAAYRGWFRGHARLLATHRGHDPGALDMARTLARTLRAPLIASTVSRLLIELNRSPTHRALFSSVLHGAGPDVRARIYEHYYVPYRTEVELFVSEAVARGGRVLHVSSHSFTPALDGEVRNADIGLLYDPARRLESELCRSWQRTLIARFPQWRVRRNYPYRGDADGLTSFLRRRFRDGVYAGVELEINQKHVRAANARWTGRRAGVADALVAAVDGLAATASARR